MDTTARPARSEKMDLIKSQAFLLKKMDPSGGLILGAIICVAAAIMKGVVSMIDYCWGVRGEWHYVPI
jgi:hypothetical protein